MNKKEIKAKVAELTASGLGKNEIFNQLSGQGIKDGKLAYIIAGHITPELRDEHEQKIKVLVYLMFIQAIFTFYAGFNIGAGMSVYARLIIGSLLAAFPIFFAWGFHKPKAGYYNVYIFITTITLLTNIPRYVHDFAGDPIVTSMSLGIGIAILGFVWFVRQQLFPDFVFKNPKKIKGHYVFTN